MNHGNAFILGSKGQRSTSQRLRRSSDIMQYCRCCVRKLCWVFPAVMARRTSNANDTGFSVRHFPASACRWTLIFPRHGGLHSYELATSCSTDNGTDDGQIIAESSYSHELLFTQSAICVTIYGIFVFRVSWNLRLITQSAPRYYDWAFKTCLLLLRRFTLSVASSTITFWLQYLLYYRVNRRIRRILVYCPSERNATDSSDRFGERHYCHCFSLSLSKHHGS